MPTSLKCCGLVPDNRSPADKDLDLPTGTLSASSNARNLGVTIDDKNSSGDEIANVNFCTTTAYMERPAPTPIEPLLSIINIYGT